jgi:MFS family permease
VQSAAVLPVVLFGLPSGALADILDRRRWFMFTQFWVAAIAVILWAVSSAGWMTAQLLLALTFCNGVGLAMRWPVYAAIVPELVPRSELPNAIALNGIAMNTSRVVGPIAAGALIASFGSGYVFLLNAVLSLAVGLLIMRWQVEPKSSVLPGERFVGAMRVGFQYVAQSQLMRSVLLRIAVFFLQSTALLALLPLVAKRMPGGDAWVYTALLASMGLGAIATAFWLPRLRVLITRDRLLRDGTIVQAVAMICVGFAPNVWVAIPPMMFAGAAWLAVANTLTVASQLTLPDWVRARGMSIYMMTMMAATAISAALWGYVADLVEVPWALVAAGTTGVILRLSLGPLNVESIEQQDLTPKRILEEPVPAFPVEHQMGPVMVTIDYRIDPGRAEEFAAVMRESRTSRLQMGALSWGLFHDTAEPGHYVEYFLDESWADHLRRFDRFTAADAELRERRHAFHIGAEPPKVTRFIAEPLETGRAHG